jgi:uncharacterized membrane protein YoaK (UPF0700 family)
MLRHKLHDYDTVGWKVFFHWYLLSFLSGSVNAGAWMACSRFVTHVTGFASLLGIELAAGHFDRAVGVATVPVYFLIGVMVSAYLIDRPARLNRQPHYTTVFFLVTLCLVLTAVMGYYNFFGHFGDSTQIKQDYFFLALLCAASGLQNAALTTSSDSTVRTTHLTGITTDLGLGIVRSMSAGDPTNLSHELHEMKLRIGTIASFILGSACGAYFFMRFGYLGFLLPTGIAGYATLRALWETQYSIGLAPGAEA